MTTDELQSAINEHLEVTGDNGKFRMTVAEEGMVWTKKKSKKNNANPLMKVLL